VSQVPTVRRRTFVFKYAKGHSERYRGWWDQPASTWQTDWIDDYVTQGTGSQATVSEGHPFRNLNASGADVGGNFFTIRRSLQVDGNNFVKLAGGYPLHDFGVRKCTYNGPLLPIDPATVVYPPQAETSDAGLEVKGATAIARCSPTNSVANLSTALGELVKDHLPAIPGMRTWEAKIRLAANAGDEFLNVVFGWAPLVADIKSTAKAIEKTQRVLRQFERDAGRPVRRRYAFDTTTDTSDALISTGVGPFHGLIQPGGVSRNISELLGAGTVTRKRITTREIWFSGAFTYFLPSGYNSRENIDRISLEAKRVFGLDLTPEVLWNLAPWSWAIDWVGNTGDVIKNITQHTQYGQILRYGYIMETCSVIDKYSWRQTTPGVNQVQKFLVPDLIAVTTTKKRRKANPFGFGLTWEGLTPIQQAIAAALGLTRGRN
jgi:hypothetical protein